ncbi:hypothetical protein NLM59_04430 [Weeksellaceae bacterium KMM 9724]|uniref:RHS repeat-associated core domain-containing protein n=1 Tax=Profundicola chukchiensis TaxID=2961959 RepID=UPI00243EF94E|nr:RHS repeat-associated core domain-containing protein [Profundicola chukchiensis]MDG4950160.1 hypothetical protein [Profundicola chukchiensis]
MANGINIKTTHYLDGFQYVNCDLSFFPHAEGYVRINGNPGKTKYRYDYIYNYTDHLDGGALKKIPVEIFSERASLSRWVYLSYTQDRSTGGLKILQEHYYYPFGLEHGSYNTPARDYRSIGDAREVETVDRNPYKYKYNSKEWQDELGLNVTAMDFRQYDNALGRFLNPDALSELAPMHTTYRFAFNNPVYWSDPTGLFESESFEFAYCPTCPNTEEFQPFIDDPYNEYDYDSESLETPFYFTKK